MGQARQKGSGPQFWRNGGRPSSGSKGTPEPPFPFLPSRLAKDRVTVEAPSTEDVRGIPRRRYWRQLLQVPH